jgi:hypothetical protein
MKIAKMVLLLIVIVEILFFVIMTSVGLHSAFASPTAFCITLPVYLSGVLFILGYFLIEDISVGPKELLNALGSWLIILSLIELRKFRF